MSNDGVGDGGVIGEIGRALGDRENQEQVVGADDEQPQAEAPTIPSTSQGGAQGLYPYLYPAQAEQARLMQDLWERYIASLPVPVPLTKENLEDSLRVWQQAHSIPEQGNPPQVPPPQNLVGQATLVQGAGLPAPGFITPPVSGANFQPAGQRFKLGFTILLAQCAIAKLGSARQCWQRPC